MSDVTGGVQRLADIRRAYEDAFRPVPPVVRAGDEMRPYVDCYAPSNKAARILDAGCGTGSWSRYLVERGFIRLDAVDLFPECNIPGATYTVSSVDNLPFGDASFDFCMSLSVIYYLDDPQRAFEEIFRVLRPGALLLLTAHTRYSLFSALRMIKYRFGARSVLHLRHSRFESVAAYRRYLEAAGFEIVRIDGYRLVREAFWRKVIALWSRGELRLQPPPMTRSKFLRCYKSWFGYHAIIVAQKLAKDL